MQSMKETAASVAASAKSGLEKTKAAVQEKGEKMTTGDPVKREMATRKKEDRMNQAEYGKREAREYNAASHQTAKAGHPHSGGTGIEYAPSGNYPSGGTGGGYTEGHKLGSTTYSTTGKPGQTTGPHQMSAVPGHGTGQPMGGYVEEGTYESYPVGRETRRAGGGVGGTPGYGAGGGYNG